MVTSDIFKDTELVETDLIPRDAMHYAVEIRPSVCLSHAGILLKCLNISSNFFTSASHTILLFPYQTLWQYSDGDLNGAIECKGYENIAIFDQYLALSQKRYNVRP